MTQHDSSESQRETDSLLQTMVVAANKGKSPFVPVTLFVKGIVVAGMLENGRNFFDHVGAELASLIVDDGEKQAFMTRFRKKGEILTREDSELSPEERARADNPKYIHLSDASVFEGGRFISKAGWWRGRIEAVDAFMFGYFGHSIQDILSERPPNPSGT